MSIAWLKYFFDYKLGEYNTISEIKEPFFKIEKIEKKKFLERLLSVNPNFNYNHLYFEYRRLVSAGLIVEFPNKIVQINTEKLKELENRWANGE